MLFYADIVYCILAGLINMLNTNTINKTLSKPLIFPFCTCLLSLSLLGSACSSDSQRVGLWNAGLRDGGFEFNFCQQQLDEAEEDSLAQKVKDQDFSTGFFLGSSDSYNFTDIINYIGVDNKSRITTFDPNGAESRSETQMEDFLELEDGDISSAATSLFSVVGITTGTSVWTFTDAAGVYHSENCMNAKSRNSSEKGRIMQADAISQASFECSQSAVILCVAK